MSYLIDDIARTLGTPMPRRKAFGVLGRLLGGAALGVLFSRRAAAAVSAPCGTSTSFTGVQDGSDCTNGVWTGTFSCPGNCPTLTTSNVTCTRSGNGTCNNGHQCTVSGTIKC